MTARVSPCAAWCDADDLPETCSNAAVKPATLDHAFVWASDVLFNITKRRWPGACSDTWRPLGCNCGRHGGHPAAALKLPVVKVRAITSVTIDGEVIDPSTYELRDGRYLWRKLNADGQGDTLWPCWQDLHRGATDQDTFVVSYTYGQDPPPAMKRAAAILAWHLALSWTPGCEAECKLPANITSMTRGGITVTMPDPASLFTDGRTHIPEVDMLVASVNHGEAKQRPVVAVPGARPAGSRGAGGIA